MSQRSTTRRTRDYSIFTEPRTVREALWAAVACLFWVVCVSVIIAALWADR